MSIVPRLTAAVCLLIAVGAAADDRARPTDQPWLDIHTYDPNGPFVTVPAWSMGMAVLVLTGGSMAVMCTPVDLILGLTHTLEFGETAQACGSQTGHAVANVTYLAAGAPFWLIKTAFWDAPRQLVRGAATDPGG
jgi:hypothetical protein